MSMISVIVPVYNVEPYLRQCIDSILAQTYADFELILVDDGSPDNCGVICDEYARRDSRIRVIHQENGGLSAARNAGIDIATGAYISFVDSDDWVHPEYLTYLYRAVREQGVLLSTCGFIRTGNRTENALSSFSCMVCDGLDWFKEDHVNGVIAWAKLYHKSLFQSIRFPIGRLHEDEFTTYKLLHLAGNIGVVNAKLYYYFINETGIIGSPYSVRRLDVLDALEERCAFFAKIGRRDMVDFARKTFVGVGCASILRLQKMPDPQPYLKRTRCRLQRFILRWGCQMGLSPLKNRWEYMIAFPKLYRLYIRLRGEKRNDTKK